MQSVDVLAEDRICGFTQWRNGHEQDTYGIVGSYRLAGDF